MHCHQLVWDSGETSRLGTYLIYTTPDDSNITYSVDVQFILLSMSLYMPYINNKKFKIHACLSMRSSNNVPRKFLGCLIK